MKVLDWSLAQETIHQKELKSMTQHPPHWRPSKRHCLICEISMPRHGKKPMICLCERHNLKVRNLMRSIGSSLELAVGIVRSEWQREKMVDC